MAEDSLQLLPLPTALPASRDPALVYLGSLSTRAGQSGMRSALRTVAGLMAPGVPVETFPWHALRYQHLQRLRALLLAPRGEADSAPRYAPATVAKALAAVRGVLRQAFLLDLLDAEAWEKIRAVKPPRGSRLPRGRDLDQEELARLAGAAPRDTPEGARGRALLALLWGCGLRRDEACSLDLASLSPGGVRVIGKGDKERLVPLSEGAARLLEPWLALRGTAPGPLLCPVRFGRLRLGRRLDGTAVWRALLKLQKRAGLKLTPHDLRRSFCTALLEAGADPLVVRDLLGHAQVQTTARYDLRGEKAKRRAVDLLRAPG